MAVQPAQLDPLPIPQLDQPGQQQAQNPLCTPAAQPQAGMGWVKPAGAAAYVASQLLTGWMAGRQQAQQKKLENARMDIQGAKTAYDVTAQAYQDHIDQGLDPNNPEDKKKLDASKMAVSAAWTNYLDRAQKYSVPDEGGKPKKKGGKEKVHDAFMGQDPQMYVDSSLKILRSGGAPALSYGTSQEEKNRLELQKKQLAEADQTLKKNATEIADQSDISALRKQYKDAQAKGDAKGVQQAKEGLAAYGVNIQHVESEAEAKIADEVAQTKLKAMETLNTPGKTANDLTPLQRGVLGIQMGPLDVYEAEVGPGKRFKSNIDAYKTYLRDTATANAIAGNSATDRQWNMMRKAEATVLQHDLQDPATAKRYGLPGPLKAGEKVPDWLIEKSVMGRLKPTAEDRADMKLNVDKSISRSIKAMLERPGLAPSDRKFIEDNFVKVDPDTGAYVINPEAAKTGSKFHLFSKNEPTIGGVAPQEYDRRHQQFYDDLGRIMGKLNPNASQDRIMQGLQSASPSDYFVDNTPTGESSTPEDRGLQPPPAAPASGSGEQSVTGKYQVEIDGRCRRWN